MKISKLLSIGTALAFTLGAVFAQQSMAQDTAVAAQPALQLLTPTQLVEQATNNVLAVARREGSALKTTPEKYFQEFSNLLEPVVDFSFIAKHVMGKKYYLAASKAQRAEFAEVFKRDLIKTYTGALATYADRSFEILPSEKAMPETGRVTVVQQISGAEGKVMVAYTMQRDDSSEPWRMSNFTLPGQGVNLGKTANLQFSRAAESYKGDVAQVIAHWGE